jgi:surface protein
MMSFPCGALFICRILTVFVVLFPFALSANACFGADDGYSGENLVEVANSKLGKAVRDFLSPDPVVSGPVKDMYGVSMNSWCVGSVTGMNYIFANLDLFNENVGGWNVGNVTTMQGMVRSFSIDLVVGMIHSFCLSVCHSVSRSKRLQPTNRRLGCREGEEHARNGKCAAVIWMVR